MDRSTPMLFSLDDKTDVGADRGTPVSEDYTSAGSEFNGKIKWVQINLEMRDRRTVCRRNDFFGA